ncbi:MAG TPA: Gfo/Idh/MocA family oxidoreductase [Gemmataceae bacterium]|nr:Gfo/Idh/MocA family oxidoreductase [Gemmataceae bacterium]
MTEPLRCALVGAGRIAQSYAHALAGCHELRPVAVVDVNAEAARAVARLLGCSACASAEELIATRPGLEAVIVCTPPSTHRNLCGLFVRQGWHVLCEKPFSLDVRSARTMLAAARKAGVLLTMASKFRYVADVIEARILVRSGLLGEVVLFENVFASRVDMSRRWNADPAVSGGGVLIDNGTHSVDLLRFFLGPLAEVQAVEGKRVQQLAVEDTVRIFVRSAQGVLGSIDLSWSINKEQDAYLTIHGSQGTLSVGWKESKYRLHASPEWVVFGKGYDKVQAFRRQLVNFARAIRGEEALVISAEDALASVEVVAAAYRSLRHSHWTAVPAGRRRRAAVIADGVPLLAPAVVKES